MKTEKEEEDYKVKMEELKNFLFLVNVYTSEFYAGFKLSEVISQLMKYLSMNIIKNLI